jgi:hypothetical protein
MSEVLKILVNGFHHFPSLNTIQMLFGMDLSARDIEDLMAERGIVISLDEKGSYKNGKLEGLYESFRSLDFDARKLRGDGTLEHRYNYKNGKLNGFQP